MLLWKGILQTLNKVLVNRNLLIVVFVHLQLSSTKDIENKSTLLHYIADTVERKFPDLLSFTDDLPHIDRAARVSTDMIQKTLRQMDTNVRNLETDLNNNKVPQSEDDLFSKVMGVSFLKRQIKPYCLFFCVCLIYLFINTYYKFIVIIVNK